MNHTSTSTWWHSNEEKVKMRLDYLDKMRIANGFKEAFECPPEIREAGERLTAWAFEAIAEARAFYAEHGEWCREEHHIGFSMTDDPGNARRWTELVRTDPYAARVSKDEETRRGLSIVTDGRIDYAKFKPVLFEGPSYSYVATGDVIGAGGSFKGDYRE